MLEGALELETVDDVPADADTDVPTPDAWQLSGKFEGDIILSARQRRIIVEDVAEGLSRNGISDVTKRWPNNELVYYIQKEHFSDGQVEAIMDGLDDIARSSCVTFRPHKKGDPDAVVIVGHKRGCFSAVGYQGGYQVLNLSARHPIGRGCFRHGTVVHELLHSLGFYHMQSSSDRDDYVDVHWDNIHEGAKHNFRKYNTFSVNDFGVPYDYDSVLHYSKRAFSKNGKPTILPKKPETNIGQRIAMSEGDIEKLNRMYCGKDSGSGSGSFDVAKEAYKKPVNKKKNNNKPFEGHGLGYYKGKSVVVKLPKLETFEITDSVVEDIPQTSEYIPTAFDGQDNSNKELQKYKEYTRDNSDDFFINIAELVTDVDSSYKNNPRFDGYVTQQSGYPVTTNGYTKSREPTSTEDSAKNIVASGSVQPVYDYENFAKEYTERAKNTYPLQETDRSRRPNSAPFEKYFGYDSQYIPKTLLTFSEQNFKPPYGDGEQSKIYGQETNKKVLVQADKKTPTKNIYDAIYSTPKGTRKPSNMPTELHYEHFSVSPSIDSTFGSAEETREDFNVYSIPDSVREWISK